MCVCTRCHTHRDYVVTGDTIGTLDEVMHLSVFLIPRFKSLFTPCSLSPNTGTRTHRCSLSHALCTLAHFITHTHTEAWMHLEVTKVANAPSWLYVCVSQQVCMVISLFLASSDNLTISQWPFQKSSGGGFQLNDAIE